MFYLGFWEQAVGDEAMALGLFGGVGQLSYVFLDMFEVSARYSTVSVLDDMRNDARAWADRQIAAETDPDEQAVLQRRYQDTGRLLAEHEVLLGFNVYLLGTTLKLQVDGGVRIHERSDGDRHDGLVRTQVQLAF